MSLLSHSPPSYDQRMDTTLTPYLQLPHLLSLTWLAYPILSIIFVAFRMQASLASSQDTIASAKANLLASCKAAEGAATSAASMPRYMAMATNEQVADAVNATLRGTRAALVLSLTVMEAIINFIIDLYRSIFLCFLELVVRGALAVVIAAVEEIDQVIGTVASALRTRIQEDIGSINNIIQGFIDTVNRLPLADFEAPRLPVPDLSELEGVSLPDSFQQSLERLNETIPSVSTIKEKLEEIVNTPFELLKKDINDTFAAISFNSSTLPVPEQSKVTFCADLDLSVVDDVGRDIVRTAKIGVVILIIIALVLIGLNCLLTWYKWRCMKAHLEYTRQAWNTDPTMHTKGSMSATPQVALTDHNLMILQANSEHPLITRITNQLSSLLRLSPRTHTHLQWFCNYIFHPPAAACLMIGFFGILLVQIQLIAMGPLVDKYQEKAAETTKDFSLLIANSINDNMLNQSQIYAAQVNAQVDAVQTTINDGVFGWVDGAIIPMNRTINEFYDDVQNSVQTVFGGSILEGVMREFIRCIIGTKVDAIENALTFLHENLNIQMPRVNDTALMLPPEAVDEASSPIAAAALGGGTEDEQGLVGRIVTSYANTLKKERVTFGIFLAIWGVVVLMGLLTLFWHSVGRPLLERKRRKRFERQHRAGLPEGFVVPFRDGASKPARDEKRGGGLAVIGDELPEFTPLPSPRRSMFKPFWASRSNSPESQEQGDATNRSTEQLPTGEDLAKTSRLKAIKARLTLKKDHEKKNSQTSDYWESLDDPNKPKLKIIVDTPSDLSSTYRYREREREAEKSRFSVSPGPLKTSWAKKLLSPPSKKKEVTQQSPSDSPSDSPSKPKHRPSVATNLGTPLDDPFAAQYEVRPQSTSLVPSPYPIPLHNGYENNAGFGVPKLASASPSRRFVAPYPPLAPPSTQSSRSHTRTSSLPQWRVTNSAPTDQISNSSTATLPDPSRLLTSATRPLRESNLNPFTTPFDDEHRVEIIPSPHPVDQRKSVNPFITPFDDEHRVEIIPSPHPMDQRRSVNAFTGVAM